MARTVVLLALLCKIFHGQVYDAVVSDGRVVDGTGRPAFAADVAISGDRVVAIGQLGGATAKRRIDARGLVVAPGFIDIHTHARRGIFAVPTAENYVRQGVTTLFDGQDGDSPLPLRSFLERLSRTPLSVNFGMFAGQGSIRAAVLGVRDRPAGPDEIARMKEMTRQAMLDGAFGLSTGLLYVPGNYTPTEEIVELARVAGELGGIHISHMRDEAAGILASVAETIRIGEQGRLPTQITHHKIVGLKNRGRSADTLRMVDEARRRGVDVTIDQYPYTASSTGTSVLFPQWSLEGGRSEFAARLADPAQRARIKAAIIERIAADRGAGDPKNIVFAHCGFDRSLAGASLADLTERRGRRPTVENAAETAIEVEQSGGCAAVFHGISEDDVERILRHPQTMIGSDGEIPIFGEGVPHPRSYGTFARVLGRYVRERNVITLEEAVRKMTSLPAARLKLEGRGVLQTGARADVVVFDPARIADTATFEKPHQYVVGVRHVLVNGKAVLLDGTITADRPGEVLYGPARK